MATARSFEYQAQYKQLRADYIKSMPAVIAAIEDTWKKLCNIGWEEKLFNQLNVSIHKLAGTGKTYGFEEMGKQAQMLDQIFCKIRDANSIPGEAEKTQVEAKLKKLFKASQLLLETDESFEPPQIKNTVAIEDLVFVVDDDQDVSNYVALLLSASGYKVRVFDNLTDFSTAVIESLPNIIIMDIVFPEGHLAGIEKINEVRATLGKNIPVVFMSARTDVVARIRALRAGGSAYITKPIEPSELLSIVEKNSSDKQNPKRALMIDDDETILEYCRILLEKEQIEVETITDPLEMLHAIDAFDPDVLLVDFNMPRCNGEELVQLLRQDERYIGLPVIMITAEQKPAIKDRVLALGGTAFLSKPVVEKELIECVNKSIKASTQTKKRVFEVLRRDPQGLINLRYLYSEIESILSTASNEETPYTLLYAAVDEPVFIRDKVGIQALEGFNKKMAGHLRTFIGENDLIARLTDFAYLILIHVADQSRLKITIDSLKNKLAHQVILQSGNEITGVTLSIGAISLSPNIRNVDEAVDIAEKASITASQNGGNQVCIEVSTRDITSNSEREVGKLFMETFKDDRIKLQYQPVVDIEGTDTVYEAFARFDAGEKILLPAQFMPYVNEYHLEHEFNKKIVLAALKDLSNTDNSISDNAAIIIKIEPAKDSMIDFVPWFVEQIKKVRLKSNYKIIFCVREKWIVKNEAYFKKFASLAKESGCNVAIEHVSVSKYTFDLINKISPAYTKLSPDFTAALTCSDASVAKETLAKLRTADTRIVACAVENADTFARLWELGIRHYQGYFVQQPESGFNYDFDQQQI